MKAVGTVALPVETLKIVRDTLREIAKALGSGRELSGEGYRELSQLAWNALDDLYYAHHIETPFS
jgi:hypothetical protein